MGQATIANEAFRIEVEGGLLLNGDVKVYESNEKLPVLVLAHGFRGAKDWSFWPEVSSRFAAAGFYTVRFDFSRIAAKGEASALDEQAVAAAHTVSQELSDLETVVRYVRDGRLPLASRADAERLAVLGHSRAGGSVIVLGAGQEEVKAVVVWNGGGSPNRPVAANDEALTLAQQAILDDLAANAERFDVHRSFVALTKPALVVQGDQDNARLLEANRKLREAAPAQAFVDVALADHTFNASHPYEGATPQLEQALEATVEFLNRTLRK